MCAFRPFPSACPLLFTSASLLLCLFLSTCGDPFSGKSEAALAAYKGAQALASNGKDRGRSKGHNGHAGEEAQDPHVALVELKLQVLAVCLLSYKLSHIRGT